MARGHQSSYPLLSGNQRNRTPGLWDSTRGGMCDTPGREPNMNHGPIPGSPAQPWQDGSRVLEGRDSGASFQKWDDPPILTFFHNPRGVCHCISRKTLSVVSCDATQYNRCPERKGGLLLIPEMVIEPPLCARHWDTGGTKPHTSCAWQGRQAQINNQQQIITNWVKCCEDRKV